MNAAETAPTSGANGTRPRLLLADDHPCILEKLRLVLEPHFEVVGTAEDGEEMLQSAAALQPDLIVADISMPRLSGIEATRRLIRRQPGTQIILLTINNDAELARKAFSAGAVGYVLKTQAVQELRRAIDEVLSGGAFLSPNVGKWPKPI